MLIVVYVVFTLLVSGLYVFLISYILKHWTALIDFSKPPVDSFAPSKLLNLSILIPARNEGENIVACLTPLIEQQKQSPHQIEILVIDDHSEDATANIAESLSDDLIVLRLKDLLDGQQANAYKKLALAHGIQQANGEYILQLDADIVVGKKYLEQICAALINEEPDFMACPVIFTNEGSAFGHFQTLDMLGMMALTGAGIQSKSWFMANGANMVYKKILAKYGDNQRASGDDIYTIQNIARDPNKKIRFLKNKLAAVTTKSEKGLASFYKQRIRWATKNKGMRNPRMLAMMLIPFLSAGLLFIHLIGWYFLGPIALSVGCFQLFTKMAIDYICLKEAASFFDMEQSMQYFIPSFFMHLVYICVIGITSLVVKNYEWKGRRVS